MIGIHNLVHGENVRAYVELKPGVTPPTAAELIKFSGRERRLQMPEEIVFLDAMPLNATGKVDRVTLKRMAEATTAWRLNGVASPNPRSSVAGAHQMTSIPAA